MSAISTTSSVFKDGMGSARANSRNASGIDISSHSNVPDEIGDERVQDLLRAIPGIKTLEGLIEIDPLTLNMSDRIDYLSAMERQSSWLQAAMQRAIVAVAGEEPGQSDGIFSGVDEAEREDIASALRLSTNTAQRKIDVARTLVTHLPNTCSALATGEISPSHATVIAQETAAAIRDGLGPAHIFKIEEAAIAHAEFHTPSQVASKVRSTLAKLAPEAFEEVVDRARDTRRVTCYNESDGLSTVVAILPAEDAQVVMKAIENFIHSQEAIEGDTRNIDMKRADALTSIATRSFGDLVGFPSFSLSGAGVASGAEVSDLRDGKNSKVLLRHRRPITVNVTIDLPTLFGLAENPGQLAGYGPIPPSVARALASDGKWKRFITDPQSGALLDFGRQSYEPPQALVDFLLARDRTCRFPGCRQPATHGDLDHAQSWESGGKTSPENLGSLCRRHHRLKTHNGWKLESFSDGSCVWTSPHGKTYKVPARSIQEAV